MSESPDNAAHTNHIYMSHIPRQRLLQHSISSWKTTGIGTYRVRFHLNHISGQFTIYESLSWHHPQPWAGVLRIIRKSNCLLFSPSQNPRRSLRELSRITPILQSHTKSFTLSTRLGELRKKYRKVGLIPISQPPYNTIKAHQQAVLTFLVQNSSKMSPSSSPSPLFPNTHTHPPHT